VNGYWNKNMTVALTAPKIVLSNREIFKQRRTHHLSLIMTAARKVPKRVPDNRGIMKQRRDQRGMQVTAIILIHHWRMPMAL